MKPKTIYIICFVLLAVIQLLAPASMVFDQENIIKNGVEIKLRTVPIDPTDPFRGKYVWLNFIEQSIQVEEEDQWQYGEEVFALIENDKEGFAKLVGLAKEAPEDGIYLNASVNYISFDSSKEVGISYPFERFYMEENKAEVAEVEHREAQLDSNSTTYAILRVKDGKAVLLDVMIDDISLRDLAD